MNASLFESSHKTSLKVIGEMQGFYSLPKFKESWKTPGILSHSWKSPGILPHPEKVLKILLGNPVNLQKLWQSGHHICIYIYISLDLIEFLFSLLSVLFCFYPSQSFCIFVPRTGFSVFGSAWLWMLSRSLPKSKTMYKIGKDWNTSDLEMSGKQIFYLLIFG